MTPNAVLWLLLTLLLRALALWVGWNYVLGPLCHFGKMQPSQAGLAVVCLWIFGMSLSGAVLKRG